VENKARITTKNARSEGKTAINGKFNGWTVNNTHMHRRIQTTAGGRGTTTRVAICPPKYRKSFNAAAKWKSRRRREVGKAGKAALHFRFPFHSHFHLFFFWCVQFVAKQIKAQTKTLPEKPKIWLASAVETYWCFCAAPRCTFVYCVAIFQLKWNFYWKAPTDERSFCFVFVWFGFFSFGVTTYLCWIIAPSLSSKPRSFSSSSSFHCSPSSVLCAFAFSTFSLARLIEVSAYFHSKTFAQFTKYHKITKRPLLRLRNTHAAKNGPFSAVALDLARFFVVAALALKQIRKPLNLKQINTRVVLNSFYYLCVGVSFYPWFPKHDPKIKQQCRRPLAYCLLLLLRSRR